MLTCRAYLPAATIIAGLIAGCDDSALKREPARDGPAREWSLPPVDRNPTSHDLSTPISDISSALENKALAALAPGHWLAVDAPMCGEGRCPNGNQLCGGSANSASIMGAWGGGVFRTATNELIIHGGGHADYCGNEVYAFDVDTFTWQRLTEPTSPTIPPGCFRKDCLSCCPAGQTDYYINWDSTPTSVHSYDSLVYLQQADAMFTLGGSSWFEGPSGPHAWLFHFGTKTWEHLGTYCGEATCPGHSGPISGFDPITGRVLTKGTGATYEFDPIGKIFQSRGDTAWRPQFHTAVVVPDPSAHLFLWMGYSTAAQVWYHDLNEGEKLKRHSATTLGDNEITQTFAPGCAFHPPSGDVVCWSGTSSAMVYDPTSETWEKEESSWGNSVFSLDLSTWTWTRHAPLGAELPPASASAIGKKASNGIFSRWQYIPDYDLFVGVNKTDGPVYFYRLP